MSLVQSVTPDITEGIPAGLGQDDATAATLKRGGLRWDVSIDGIGFMLGINDQNPYLRESAPVQKQQFDASPEAGEQTLDGLWIRSQTSWHLGAGANFYEPGSRDDGSLPSRYRFHSSVGVDVWGEGDLTLLKATSQTVAATGACYAAAARTTAGGDIFFTLAGGTLTRHTDAGATTNYTDPVSGNPVSKIAIAGSKVLVGTGTAIASGDLSGSALTDLWTAAPAAPTPYWAKSRIVASAGASLYELTLAGGAWPATPLFTHPDSGWTWTDVAEGPDAILAAGHSGGGSAVYSFTLETNSGAATPKLGQPFQVLELPPGEEIHALHVYLGTYVGIGTSRGLRVGAIGEGGRIQVGPLLFTTTAPVRALGARDAYLYAGLTNGIEGLSGCARVDLGAPIGDGLVFPWATDAQAGVIGDVLSLAFVGHSDRVVLGVKDAGVYTQSATVYEASGYLLSGAVRYGTTEAKAFRFADVRCRTADGSGVGLSIVGPTDEEVPLVTLSNGATGSNLSLASLAQRLEYASYKLTLSRTTDTLGAPTVESVALKAIPVVKRQRLIKYPVLMFEKQQDGMKAPFSRNVAEILQAIEGAEESKAVVQVVDYRLGESFPATIESVRFVGSTPSTGSTRGGNNAGGRGEIVVRKL